MKRSRALLAICTLGFGFLLSLDSIAQPAVKPAVIGIFDAGERLEWWSQFRKSLRDHGYVEGKDVAFETRFAKGKYDQLPAIAQDLVRLKVAVIVTAGGVAAMAAKQATDTIPIVMTSGGDPITLGLADTLAHPGGNVTGSSSHPSDLAAKRIQLMRELLRVKPGLVLRLRNPLLQFLLKIGSRHVFFR